MASTDDGKYREEIYRWIEDDGKVYNPYSYKNYLEELFDADEEIYEKFKEHIKEIINDWYKIADVNERKIYLKIFLKRLSHVAIWKENHIKDAKILLITNEPGLTGVEKLYKNFFHIRDDEYFKKFNALNDTKITKAFHFSMLSWLALVDHPIKEKINGEGDNTENDLKNGRSVYNINISDKFKLFGKIGYFIEDNEISIFKNLRDQGKLKCIHIDLFPFAQDGGDDENPYNCKDEINKCIDKLVKNNFCLKFDCKCSFTCCIIQKNIEMIKKFCESASYNNKKFVFIIGNRAIMDKRKIRNRNINTNNLNNSYFIPFSEYFKDNAIITFKILKEIIFPQIQNNHIECRLIPSWPSGFGYKTILTLSSRFNTITIRRDDDIEVDIEVIELSEVN